MRRRGGEVKRRVEVHCQIKLVSTEIILEKGVCMYYTGLVTKNKDHMRYVSN